jgi:signal transduction histidine kinase
MHDDPPSSPRRIGPLLGAATTVVLTAGVFVLAQTYSDQPVATQISEVTGDAAFGLLGSLAWYLQPRSRIGPWLVVLGLTSHLANPFELSVRPETPGYAVLIVIGVYLCWVQFLVAGLVLLTYPTGRLTGRLDRRLVAVGVLLVVPSGTARLLTLSADPALCDSACVASPIPAVADRMLYLELRQICFAAWVVLALAVVGLMIVRACRATARAGRGLRFTLVLFALSAALLAAELRQSAAVGGASAAGTPVRYALHWVAVVALPGMFLLGLLRQRLAFASIGTLADRLSRLAPGEVENALREGLRDPTLRVLSPEPAVADAGPDTVVTPVGDPPLALVVHDRMLLQDPELLNSALGAARLALENARLRTAVEAGLGELRAAQRRVVTSADAERRQLERDLHDGAQQRFLGVGVALGMLASRLESQPEQELVATLRRDLGTAIQELRELAHGVRPAVLSEAGLVPAVRDLAARSGLPVTLRLGQVERLPAVVEGTAYFVISEALQNVRKHACGAAALVRMELLEDRLRVDVIDEGPGAADPAAGTGLIGLADRVASLGGRFQLHSPRGDGTRIHVELPVAGTDSRY